jgi:nickel/cobalt transporter (NicO) family protein
MNDSMFLSLCVAAATVGSLHTIAPDHWAPFIAVARAQNWSARRTALTTIVCGFGHVTSSVILGLVALFLGMETLKAFGETMETAAGFLLIGFGLAYGIWGLRRAVGAKLHGHSHAHYDHVHDPHKITALSLFLLFSADPCVAVMPLMFAAARLGALKTTTVVITYELCTIATMAAIVLPGRAGAKLLRASWIDRYSHAVAGGVIAVVGTLVVALGW